MDDNSNIKDTFEKLNKHFEKNNIDNKVLVLDFSHFTKIDASKYNIKIVLYGFESPVTSYRYVMEEAATESAWKKFGEPIVRIISNFESNSWQYKNEEIDNVYSSEPEYYPNAPVENNFVPKDITSTLKNGPGKAMLFLAKSFNEEEAQSVIYVTLKNEIELPEGLNTLDFRTNKHKLSNGPKEILENCFDILGELLISEMVHSLYENWQKTELDKQKIVAKEKERELIFRKLFHSQKQHLALLSYLAKVVGEKDNKEIAEIIEYTQKSLSEFLDINKYITESEFTNVDTDLIDDLQKLIHVFEIITSDKKILEEGIRLRDYQYDPIVEASGKGKLFSGNYSKAKSKVLNLPVGIPKLIFKEIIVNAIQHSKWDEPNIEINIEESEKEIIFNFSNNVTPDMIDKLNETVSHNNHGRDLIESLSEKIEWSVIYSGLKEDLKVQCSVHIKK